MREHAVLVDIGTCVGCGLCAQDCSLNNIAIVERKSKIFSQDCIKCGHCVAICPVAAVSMTGFDEMPVEVFR